MTTVNPVDNPYIPKIFPAWWASDWGQDKKGLWMAFTFQGVRQMFRWIRPGRFQMGSPESEIEGYSDETLHEVTLTQGYWLADTACTQALWQAVMEDNPASFKEDENNPVEQVSWDDVQLFIDKINQLISGLNACLPTEAQWEYACRAGTETPFSFGENITPELVNYDGNSPYAEGGKGLYRGKTVAVKSLPINPWGLYEMHGNVWEWCQDSIAVESIIDPVGSVEDVFRVIRGGFWGGDGWGARSAYRGGYELSIRYNNTGFRLALGQTEGIHPEQESQ